MEPGCFTARGLPLRVGDWGPGAVVTGGVVAGGVVAGGVVAGGVVAGGVVAGGVVAGGVVAGVIPGITGFLEITGVLGAGVLGAFGSGVVTGRP